jgi:hypothetical protein
VPTLTGKTDLQKQHEFLYWEFHEGGFKQAALYQGRWKGIRTGSPEAAIRLYDQPTDITETKDVAVQHPDIAARIGDYLQSARTPLPEWEPRWSPAKKK